jgi:hypothetical protein
MITKNRKNAWLTAFLGFIVPGGGHCYQERFSRGILLGGSVLFCFGSGLWFGGHLFSIEAERGAAATLLKVPPFFANLGIGLPFVLSWLLNVGFVENAKLYTFEYGNTFLLIAGLLNYLTVLDAFDIARLRKS